MSTIREVARLAGVSIATVSRTLSQPNKVTEETRRKVQAAIDKSGYTGNPLSRIFRTQRTQMVLVLMPFLGSPFFAHILQGMEEIARRHGYRIVVTDTQGHPESDIEYLRGALQHQVDGIILLGRALSVIELESGAVAMPLVMACEYLNDRAVTSVGIDNAAAAQEATEHLLALGHRRIAFFKGPPQAPVWKDRLRGYRQALKRYGVAYDKDLVVNADFTPRSGELATRALLDSKIDFSAIFATTDAMAVAAVKELREEGIAVPKQISVIGFDDLEIASYLDPPLTTVRQPRHEMGRAAMQKMIDKLQGASDSDDSVLLPHHLVVRKSTGPKL